MKGAGTNQPHGEGLGSYWKFKLVRLCKRKAVDEDLGKVLGLTRAFVLPLFQVVFAFDVDLVPFPDLVTNGECELATRDNVVALLAVRVGTGTIQATRCSGE
jgi:hypothetical protein